jgi:hypothetical protein
LYDFLSAVCVDSCSVFVSDADGGFTVSTGTAGATPTVGILSAGARGTLTFCDKPLLSVTNVGT